MPLLVDTNLTGNVWDWATTQPADPTTTDDPQGADDAEGDLLINTFGATAGTVPSEGEQADVAEDDPEQDEEEEPFLNRAERRAQQRADRRNQRPRS